MQDVVAGVRFDSPPAPVEVSLGYNGAHRAEPLSTERTGAAGTKRSWRHDEMIDVELVTTSAGRRLPPRSAMTIDGFIGAVWRARARAATAPLTIRAFLPGGQTGSPDSGEHLETMDVETDAWRMAIGGYDDDIIAELIGDAFPGSWAGLMHPGVWGGRYGARFPSPDTLTWVLPGLMPTEGFDFHIAIAWLNTLPSESEGGTLGPWFAVDTTPQTLLNAAESQA